MNGSSHAGEAGSGLLDPHEAAVLSHTFRLLGDPARLRLLIGLMEAEELCVSDLAQLSGQSESAVSHALRLMRAHEVVSARRDGRMVFYRLADDHVRMLLELATAHVRHPGSP
ncbi:metalloregulator ArsR/SmtB family transcription factor [Cellulomonas sp. ACRRI]|uniref:ArsR/SmtB family transcription factor n=1 Tax=Cellulomonas sp. ACRRI TaxID=2918188 RepID=UPI001EF1F603|nr:metalloregulator ArsR/SmtB family transcription factor [Cellulomonas sp. ACRRI]MCG7284762.1 metalloregulator ArsR/SmtB family transcription factor [Cellulomonas sp. ACRRI]